MGGERAVVGGARAAAARAGSRSSSATSRAFRDAARPAGGGDPRRRALAPGLVRCSARATASCPARACRSSAYAIPYRFTAEELERGVAVLEGWLAAPTW